MLEQIKYVNHLNETIIFGKDGILVNTNTLRDYAWTYNSLYSRITAFTRQTSERQIPFVVYGGNAKANRMFEIFEKDILAGKAGKFYIGDYYIEGFIFASAKGTYGNGIIKGVLRFVSDKAQWIKAVSYVYRPNDASVKEGYGYSYDFPYDYTSAVNTQDMNNTSFTDADFILTIYGQATNPVVTIANHPYKVNVDLVNREYLTINSYEKTITKTDIRGNKTNVFALRDLDNYIFQKIPQGESKIITSADFNFDITLLMERSEPEWI